MGVMLPASATEGSVEVSLVLEAARRCEALGFDGVYVGDHLLHPRNQLESLTTLAAVAAVTDRIELGTCVLLLALRDPLLTAKQLATLARLAPGRLRIGVGAGGEYPEEFEVAGMPMEERGRRLDAALRQVRDVLTDGFTQGELTLAEPAPDVRFVVGGWSDAALRRAATLGDGWIGYLLRPDSFARRRELLVGRRGEAFTTGMLLPIRVGGGDVSGHWARVTGKAIPEELFVGGTPDEVVEGILRYRRRGCDEVVLAPAVEPGHYLEQLELLAREVVPRLHRTGTVGPEDQGGS